MDDYEQRIEAVLEHLVIYLKRYERAHDPRATFTYVYCITTAFFLEAKDDFSDPYWVARFVQKFAQEFIDATEAYDQGKEVSLAWLTVFQTAHARNTSILEEMVYGMTAHMVHDLPLVLTKVGMMDRNGKSRIKDFNAISSLLVGGINIIQREVAKRYNPLLGWLDRLAHCKDERITAKSLRLTRGIAWFNAQRLLDPTLQQPLLHQLARFPGNFIRRTRKRLIIRLLSFFSQLTRRWPKEF